MTCFIEFKQLFYAFKPMLCSCIQQKRQGRTRTPRVDFKTSLFQANSEISQFLEKIKGNFIKWKNNDYT